MYTTGTCGQVWNPPFPEGERNIQAKKQNRREGDPIFFPRIRFFLFILRILKYFITDENNFKLDNLYFMYDFIQCEMPITWFFLRYNLGTGSIFAYRRGGVGGCVGGLARGSLIQKMKSPDFRSPGPGCSNVGSRYSPDWNHYPGDTFTLDSDLSGV